MTREMLVAIVVLTLSVPLLAQGRRGGGGGAGGMRQGPGPQGGYGQGMGMGSNSQSQARTPQQERYRECTQATSRLRKTLRKMSRLQTGKALGADQARRYRHQLREQLHLLVQERTDWLNTFSEEQTAELQPEIASSAGEVQKLQDLVGMMDLELGEESVDGEKVAKNAAQAEATVEKVEQQQQELSKKVESAGKGE